MLALAAIAGCAASEPRFEEFPAGAPLPYSVGVYFEPALSAFPSAAEPAAPAVPADPAAPAAPAEPAEPARAKEARKQAYASFRASGDDVAAAVARALAGESRIVSQARVLDVESKEEALQKARSQGIDLICGVGIQAPRRYDEMSRPLPTAILEVVCWLFGGIPAWFVPSLDFKTGTELRLDITDVNLEPGEGSETSLLYSAACEQTAISLWDRADILDQPAEYALTIIVPPMFVVPDDRTLASESLTGNVLERISGELEEGLKPRLIAEERMKPLRIVFRSPLPGDEVGDRSLALSFDLISEAGGEIEALDVHRLAPRAERLRWVAGAEDLSAWNERLKDSRDSRITIQLPTRVPLEPGANAVKLRVLRTDGTRVSRTAVIEYEEK
ncbi:MAG: hypothetical protein JXA90_04010 [Planctomycetes bacterium]|nr:hypothetical protein [Planctomycetota bacterium]